MHWNALSNRRLAGALPLLAALVLAACASTPEAPSRAEISDEVVVQAAVLSVDKDTREITLQRPDGSRVVVVAGPEVRNFDRIEAGNTVTVRYKVSLSARRLAPEEAGAERGLGVAAARAAEGEAPAGTIVAGAAMTVVIRSVDTTQHLVVFADADGAIHAVQAEREEGRRFIAGLKPGDRVEIVYGESLALSVE